MTRKSWIISTALIAVLATAGIAALTVLLRHEPGFYLRSAIPPSPQRVEDSRSFQERAITLIDRVGNETEWREEFTEKQVNSWLDEDFLRRPELNQMIPAEITEPRVVFQPGKILLAFRYREGGISSIISLEAKIWLSPAEPNTLALEIHKLRAGALPLSLKAIQDELTEVARHIHMDIQWYRNDGYPVAVMRLEADKREPEYQLQLLELRQGSLVVKGRSLDPDFRSPAAVGLRVPSP